MIPRRAFNVVDTVVLAKTSKLMAAENGTGVGTNTYGDAMQADIIP